MKPAFRRLVASPGFTVTALLTLALGIGVNTSMFSVLHALLLQTPYPDDGQLVLGRGLRLAALGTAFGLLGALAIARLLQSIAPGLPPADLLTTLVITAGLLAIALLACWLPARRAARIDPIVALRAE